MASMDLPFFFTFTAHDDPLIVTVFFAKDRAVSGKKPGRGVFGKVSGGIDGDIPYL